MKALFLTHSQWLLTVLTQQKSLFCKCTSPIREGSTKTPPPNIITFGGSTYQSWRGHIQTKAPLMVKVLSLTPTSHPGEIRPSAGLGSWIQAESSHFLKGPPSWMEALKCLRRCPEVGMRVQGWKGAAWSGNSSRVQSETERGQKLAVPLMNCVPWPVTSFLCLSFLLCTMEMRAPPSRGCCEI